MLNLGHVKVSSTIRIIPASSLPQFDEFGLLSWEKCDSDDLQPDENDGLQWLLTDGQLNFERVTVMHTDDITLSLCHCTIACSAQDWH